MVSSGALRAIERPSTMPGRATALSAAQPQMFEKFNQHYDARYDVNWQTEVQNEICRLITLGPNWDGYGAPEIRRDAGMFVLEVLSKVMQPRTSLPCVVPSSIGGIQIEWHEKGIDLEFHVAAPYECELWFHDHLGANASISVELKSDFTQLGNAIGILTKR